MFIMTLATSAWTRTAGDGAAPAALTLLWAALGVLFHAPAAVAEPTDGVTYAAAARRALAASPAILAGQRQLEALAAREATATQRPVTELLLAVEDALGTGEFRGARTAEFTVSLTSLLERGGKRQARVAAAASATSRQTVEQRVVVLDVLAETGRRFVGVAAAQERLRLAERTLAEAEAVVRLIEPRVAAARSPRIDLLYARIDREQAAVDVAAATRELDASSAALAVAWGTPTERPRALLDFLKLPEPLPVDSLVAGLATLPDLERYASEARQRDAELRLASAQTAADLRWQLGIRQLQEPNEQSLVANVYLPLGQRARARPLVREAEANRAVVDAAAAGAQAALSERVRSEHARLSNAREVVAAITETQLPLAEEARLLADGGYRIGRFPYRELANARRQLLELEVRRTSAATLYHLTRIELERLSGGQLDLIKE